MKTIYIGPDFKCHAANDGTMTAVETDFFDGKCNAYIEGYRLVPAGESWVRKDGVVFRGEMITPLMPHSELAAAQAQYEKDLLDRADLEAAYNYLLTGGTA
ncbi:MAG: hypothetical protein J6Q53_04890 [Oscillospiraceae bacterium]|nr:hypothetical protein [Oscillospiraceae bacterium]